MATATISSDAANFRGVKRRHDAQPSRYAPFVLSSEAGEQELMLAVDGIHCARCIWAIESALQAEANITHARVNMTTKRLVIGWQGEPEMADRFADLVSDLGYSVTPFDRPDKQSQSEDKALLRAMAVAGFSMGNIMLLSVALWSSEQAVMGIATRDLLHWISALIALPTIAYAGRPFFRSAIGVLKRRRTNMDVPISLALLLATGMSLFETIHSGEHAYFDSAVMLLFFLLIGRWLDARARGKARENAAALLGMMEGVATVINDKGVVTTVRIKELSEGMVIRVAAGEKIPTDAKIIHGESELDTSLITGETLPRIAKAGDIIYGGTINMSAPLTCSVVKASEDSLLADIVRLMEQAEQGRAQYVRLADKAAKLYTPVVHTLALGAFLGWYFLGGMAWQDALLIAITTLIITCPCALALAVPVVQVLATSWLMRRGILVKSGDALERLARIDTVVFDKTGTLTEGKPQLTDYPEDTPIQQLALSLASYSQHPLSQALTRGPETDRLPLERVREHQGLGMEAYYDGKRVRLGRRSWCGDQQAPADHRLELWLQVDDDTPQRFLFADPVRYDTRDVTGHLAPHHDLYLLSGDRADVAHYVADELSIEHVQAECLPDDKIYVIEALQQRGRQVLMVGDGLNDAPALTAADVSMSPASGMDITQNAADIVFQGKALWPVYGAWQMARYSTKLVKQNFALAVLYNCIAIPIALAGMVTPLVAAVAMSSSSLVVVANAFRVNLTHAWEKR